MILSKVRFKNFFSSGNAFIEVDILKYKRVVTSGKNGAGKSTILNSIVYALFKKTIKKTTKSQITNSINNKACVVELEGWVDYQGGKSFMIRRGIKPDVFELYENDVLVDQKLVGDYQEYIEQKIIKASYRTFIQTSILSVENYTPFMSLSAGERRSFIEDILDIQVFTVMNQLTKAEDKKLKEELKVVTTQFQTLKDKINLLKSHIEDVESMQEESDSGIKEELEQKKEELAEAELKVEPIEQVIQELEAKGKDYTAQKRLNSDLSSLVSEARTQLRTVEKTLNFFESNDNCPTCTQPIEEKNVSEILHSHRSEQKKLTTERDELLQKMEVYADLQDKIDENNKLIREQESKLGVIQGKISSLKSQIRTLTASLNKPKVSTNVDEQKLQLRDMAIEAKKVRDRQTELNTEIQYSTLMLELLKDSGIKSKIVDQYIPVINQLMNEYLEKLDLFVSFNLDSEFNETVKSRYRDLFTYNSFSAGEKQKIDLAIMFTMRRLAVMKSSFHCNLLGADEVLDAAVDSEGVGLITEILMSEEFDKTNLMVVSHRNSDLFQDLFDGRYEMRKRDGFSELFVL